MDLHPPQTPKKPVTDILHGHKTVDDYRWLEDDNSPAVKKWTAEQNEYVDQVLAKHANVDYFRDQLASAFDVDVIGLPAKFGNRYFWVDRKADQDFEVLFVRDDLADEPRVLLDMNALNKEGAVSIDYYHPSRDGKYLAYGLSRNGDEMATLYVMDVGSGQNLKDEIPHARHSALAWLPDNRGFYIERCPLPGEVDKNEEHLYNKIYFHQLGDHVTQDKLIFGEGRPKDDMVDMRLSLDGRYLIIWASQSWNRNDLFIFDSQTRQLRPIVVGYDAKFSMLPGADYVYVKTNLNAPNYRLVRAPLNNIPEKFDDWTEVLPETSHILGSYWLSKDKLLALYRVDAVDQVKVYGYEGRYIKNLPLPEMSSVTGISAREYEKEFFYGAMTFLLPKVIYRFDPASEQFSEYRCAQTSFNSDQFEARQEWTVSKDGTRIPVFVMHRKDLVKNGQNPTVLWGYGCHGVAQSPKYSYAWMTWVNNGGVFAVAIIRGGGEYGEQWHRDGSLDKKQNTFDDFIAVAEHLIDQKYTSTEHLAIQGGSNGGLMVGAVMTQQPNLMKAVLCQVPVLDMTRFHKFLIAGRWVHEFGDPEKPVEFEWLMRWSPYHHVHTGVRYPAVFFETADHDTRVAPLHARKMAAKMQSVDPQDVILLRTASNQGHTAGGRSKKAMIDDKAEQFAFYAWQLGLKI